MADISIADVRAKYPQYSDLSDEQLAKGLHQKFYSDIPYDQFAAKIGLNAKPQPAEAPKPSLTLPANAGLANFGASLIGLPGDTLEGAANILDRAGRLASVGFSRIMGNISPEDAQQETNLALYGGNRVKLRGTSEDIKNALRSTGEPGLSPDNPQPDSELGKLQYDITSRGGFIPGGAVPAAGSIVAEKVLGPDWAGVGALTPQAVSRTLSAAKTAIATPQTVKENIETFKKVGTTPDVAQATDSNFFRGLTNVVGRVPGGQGVIAKFRELEQKALGQAAETGVSAESAGRAIQKGVTGEGGFLERTRAKWQQLDDAVAAKVPTDAAMAPQNTVQALGELTTPAKGAERTTGALVNPTIAKIKDNLAADLQANNGAIPFDALRKLRTNVGEMLDDSLVSGVPNGQLKKLYGALSKDLEEAANASGAGQEFARQNAFYRARMERINNTLEKVVGKGTPEEVFKAVAPTDVDAVNKIRRVMRSLNPSEREVVSDAIVNRLGRATPGKQTLDMDFSSETFLTNWNKMNESAKAQLFPDTEMRGKLDSIAKVSSDIREGKTPFGNPSGTTQGFTANAIYGSVPVAAVMAMSGNVSGAAKALMVSGSLVAGANIGAKMLTSPRVVNWLAQSTKPMSAQQQVARLAQLGVIYNETKDQQLKQELAGYVDSVNAKINPKYVPQ